MDNIVNCPHCLGDGRSRIIRGRCVTCHGSGSISKAQADALARNMARVRRVLPEIQAELDKEQAQDN